MRAILCNKNTKMCELLFMIYYIRLKTIETQTGWWTDDTRRDHTIWPRVKMERGGRIQYCKIKKWTTLKISTFLTDYMCSESGCDWLWYTCWHQAQMSSRHSYNPIHPCIIISAYLTYLRMCQSSYRDLKCLKTLPLLTAGELSSGAVKCGHQLCRRIKQDLRTVNHLYSSPMINLYCSYCCVIN